VYVVYRRFDVHLGILRTPNAADSPRRLYHIKYICVEGNYDG